MNRRFQFLFFLFVILAFLRCEKYLGHDLNIEPDVKTTKIFGRITNRFNQLPVDDAIIRAGIQKTKTNIDGEYSIIYVLGTDEARNKPVPITVTADNYFTFASDTVLYPIETEIDIQLEYAAPKITRNVFVFFNQEIWILQAEVFDHQGIENIDTVKAFFYYERSSDNSVRKITVGMGPKGATSQNSSYYQCTAYPTLDVEWQLRLGYEIEVKDSDGFNVVLEDFHNPFAPDSLLFPPDL